MKRAFVMLAIVFSTAACSQKNFSADEEAGKLGHTGNVGLTCSEVLQNLTVPVKVVFSVDISGSNEDHYDKDGVWHPGNDIGKARRGGAIESFFNTYGSRANFSWAFLTFNFGSSYSLIGLATNPRFSTSASQMSSAIRAFYSLADDDGTPYEAALSRIEQTIANDSGRGTDTKYVVVFISDGRPDPDVDTATLINKVHAIQALAPGQVTFNTIYYGATSADAQNRLATMASAGGGAYLNAADGRVFDINDAIQVPGTSCE